MYYFGVRYYAAWLGRWTSSDPGGFVDGVNLYVYVRNNPVNGVDLEGYSTEEVEQNLQQEQSDPPPTNFESLKADSSWFLVQGGEFAIYEHESGARIHVESGKELYIETGEEFLGRARIVPITDSDLPYHVPIQSGEESLSGDHSLDVEAGLLTELGDVVAEAAYD